MTIHHHLSSSLTALALATMSAAASAGPLYDVQAVSEAYWDRVTGDGVTLRGQLEYNEGWNRVSDANEQGLMVATWRPEFITDGFGSGVTLGPEGIRYIDVPGHNRTALADINASGVVVGTTSRQRLIPQTDTWSIIGTTDERAFTDDHGQVAVLGTLGGSWSRGQGINAMGQVVGSSATVGDAGEQAFLYSNGQMLSLGTLGGVSSRAMAINDAGQIVGQAQSSDRTTAFIYTNGAMQSLAPAIDVHGATLESKAHLINNRGDVVIEALAFGDTWSFLWRDGVATALPGLPVMPLREGGRAIQRVSAADINDQGEVVGTSFRGGLYESRATLWRDGQVLDLNDLVSMDATTTLRFAVNIDESSRILAWGDDNRLYRLTPSAVPEPGSMVLMAIGLLGVAGVSLRQRPLTRRTSI